MTADEALARLIEGNWRFAANRAIHPNTGENRRLEVRDLQRPFAIILGCADSRVPPEIVFDCGLGDLFVVRTAGHAVDKIVLASLQFGVVGIGVPLLVVLGHTRCGAVKTALNAVCGEVRIEPAMQSLVEKVRPAVEKSQGQADDWLDSAVRMNVELTVRRLQRAKLLSQAIKQSGLRIVGAYYDLDTGVAEVICEAKQPGQNCSPGR